MSKDSIANNNTITGIPDSTSSAVRSDSTMICCVNCNQGKNNDPNPVLTLGITFGISVFLVVIISYIKYRLDKVSGFKENMMFYSELPIDINTVAITILLTYYNKVSSVEILFFFIFLSIFLSLIMTSLRRSLLNGIEKMERWTLKSFLCIAGEYVLLLVSLIMIYNVVI